MIRFTTAKAGIIMVFITVVMLVSPIIAKGASEQTPVGAYEALDALGRIVRLDAAPSTIVVPGKAALMPADALYLFDQARQARVYLAKTDQGLGDFFDVLLRDEERSPRLGQQVSIEALIALKPDLVIAKTSNQSALGERLDDFGIPVFYMELEDARQWSSEIEQLGRLLGDQKRAQEISAFYKNRENVVVDTLSTLAQADKPRVLVLQAASTDGTTVFSVAPAGWIQTYIVQQAGGIPVWLDVPFIDQAWKKVSFEQIATWKPDVVYIVSYRSDAAAFLQEIEADTRWQALHASSAVSVKAIPADYVNFAQSDSRWILALEFMAADLHPDKFPLFSMVERIESFYRQLYRIEDDAVIARLVAAYRTSVGER